MTTDINRLYRHHLTENKVPPGTAAVLTMANIMQNLISDFTATTQALLQEVIEMRKTRIEEQVQQLTAEPVQAQAEHTAEMPAEQPADVGDDEQQNPTVCLKGLDDCEYLTAKDITERVGCPVSRVYQWLSTGDLPSHRVGNGRGLVRISVRDFKQFVHTNFAA